MEATMKTIVIGLLVAIVDDEDYAAVVDHAWRCVRPCNVAYAMTNLSRAEGHSTLYMHQLVLRRMGLIGSVDHVNGNGLDNRRTNLRTATAVQNAANVGARPGVSGFKGVSRCSKTNRSRAYIRTNGRQIHLGLFASEREAAAAYDNAARSMWGEYARTNL